MQIRLMRGHAAGPFELGQPTPLSGGSRWIAFCVSEYEGRNSLTAGGDSRLASLTRDYPSLSLCADLNARSSQPGTSSSLCGVTEPPLLADMRDALRRVRLIVDSPCLFAWTREGAPCWQLVP